MVEDVVALFQHSDRSHDLCRGVADRFCQVGHTGSNARDAVGHKPGSHRVYQVDHVVNPAGQLVDVLAVKRRNKRLIQLGHDFVRDGVPNMFVGFDLRRGHGRIFVMLQHFHHRHSGCMDVFRLLYEVRKKRLFLRKNPSQSSRHFPKSLRWRPYRLLRNCYNEGTAYTNRTACRKEPAAIPMAPLFRLFRSLVGQRNPGDFDSSARYSFAWPSVTPSFCFLRLSWLASSTPWQEAEVSFPFLRCSSAELRRLPPTRQTPLPSGPAPWPARLPTARNLLPRSAACCPR